MNVTLSLFAGAGAQFFDNSGYPLTGGKIYSYAAGTTTPAAVYTTSSGTVAHANPIVLDAAGRVPSGGEIWLPVGVGFKFVVKSSTDTLIATYDNVPTSASAPIANDATAIAYEQGYTVTAGSFVVGKTYQIKTVGTTDFTLIGATSNTVGSYFVATGVGTGTGTAYLSQTVAAKLQQTVSVKDFGAVGDGVTDDYAAFQAAVDSLSASNSDIGGLIIIPSGTYYLSQTWKIKKRVTIRGTNAGDQPQTSACRLNFPADTDGIRFYSSIDSGTGTDATQSVLQFVEVKALAKNSSGVGIKCTTTVRIEYCIVRDFKSHGIEFYGQTGGGATGICDFWKVANTRIITCGGNGLYTHGNDSQIGLASQVECVANSGYGFYDVSAYGNTYIACQAAGNTGGSYYSIPTTTYFGSTFLGCYVEFGTGQTATFDTNSLVLGGVLAAVAGDSFYMKAQYPGISAINCGGTTGRLGFTRSGA